ncbi:MAG: shikimate kinase, partial [Deltaproteobacteria bacterium]
MPTLSQKIILTGFRATGKTTVGRLLAAELGLAFMDMDQELVRRHGPIDAL